MDGHEQLMAQLRREFKPGTVAKVRKAQITAAASPFSYSVLLPGETDDRDSVVSISPVTPLVGDFVRVEFVGDEPCIVAVYGRGPIRRQNGTACTASNGLATYATSGLTSDVIDQDMVAGQSVWVTVRARSWHTVAGSGHAAILSFQVTGADTYGPNDEDGTENDDTVSTTASSRTLYTAATTGMHHFTLVYRAVGGATANFVSRRITVEE